MAAERTTPATAGPVPVIDDGLAPGTAARAASIAATLTTAGLLGGLGLYDLATAFAGDSATVRVEAAAARLAPELLPAWRNLSPAALPRRPVAAELANAAGFGLDTMLRCEVNEVLLRSLWQPGTGLAAFVPNAPSAFATFRLPNDEPNPRYRYPPHVAFPDGLSTNNFGFRGPDLAVAKPERTIRIACVGASTTVDAHHFRWSYPELLQPWLTAWAAARGFAVRFEVINAGRAAIRSPEIRAIVEYEVLPLAVDYVVYFEGANQCGVADLQRHVVLDAAASTTPPTTLVTTLPQLAGQLGAAPQWLHAHGANLRRLARLVGFGRTVAEPPKPAQHVQLPTGFPAQGFDLARAGEILQLGAILGDLDRIDTACRSQGAQLVLCSFPWLVADGLQLDLADGHSTFAHLNTHYWPLSYATIRTLTDLQNRGFVAWATSRQVPLLDLAATMPLAPELYSDAVHTTEAGSRLRAWLIAAGLIPILEADLASHRRPVADARRDPEHPFLKPARRLTAAELDRR